MNNPNQDQELTKLNEQGEITPHQSSNPSEKQEMILSFIILSTNIKKSIQNTKY